MDSSSRYFIFEPFKVILVKSESEEVPRPRSGHRIVCDDANIYCFGGYNPGLQASSIQIQDLTWTPEWPLFKELWSFSIASRKWRHHRVIDNMPNELASNAMCLHGRYLMIYGGTGMPFGHRCSNEVIVWRITNGDGRLENLRVSSTKPPPSYGPAIFCYNGYFYTIGGTDGLSYSCDIYRFDLRTLVWEPVYINTGQENEPLGRYRHEVARVDSKLYLIGGGTSQFAFELMTLPVFDFETRTWARLSCKGDDSGEYTLLPSPRKCHSLVQIDTPDGVQVFVAGGTNGHFAFEDVWRLNISDLQWTLMQETVLPGPLCFHSASVTSYGCMYLFGGIEPSLARLNRSNNLYKVWLCIPKLSEICWEALLHFQPKLDQVDINKLLSIGIPRHLVQRLHPNINL